MIILLLAIVIAAVLYLIIDYERGKSRVAAAGLVRLDTLAHPDYPGGIFGRRVDGGILPAPQVATDDRPPHDFISHEYTGGEKEISHHATQDILDLISAWFGRMKDRHFVQDPILTTTQTKIHDIAHMAIAEHGRLIEHAIKDCLHGRDGFTVWGEGDFQFADHRVQVDLLTYDATARTIRAYEIKRVSDKPQSSENLKRVGAALKTYAANLKPPLPVETTDTFTITYYGAAKGDADHITRETINVHFGCDVIAAVDGMTEKFKASVQSLLEPPIGVNERRAAA